MPDSEATPQTIRDHRLGEVNPHIVGLILTAPGTPSAASKPLPVRVQPVESASAGKHRVEDTTVATHTNQTVVGLFPDRASADQAVCELKDAGYQDSQISVVGATTEAEATASGAATGAAVGAGAAALASLGISFGVIPVIGPVLAMGPLSAALLSAVGGAAAGGLTGALVGLGFSQEDADYYQDEVKKGNYLVTVDAGNRSQDAQAILTRRGGYRRQSGLV